VSERLGFCILKLTPASSGFRPSIRRWNSCAALCPLLPEVAATKRASVLVTRLSELREGER
jgi:hypothetical protein